MKLPNGARAVVPPSKLNDYLLSEAHPAGRSKARFFRGVGFTATNADRLARELLAIARMADVVASASSPHGVKYVVDGALATPLAGIVRLRTVWITEAEEDRPRFVTAYPAPDNRKDPSHDR